MRHSEKHEKNNTILSTQKSILLNGVGQVGNRAVRIAEQLLLVPFFLSIWGAEYYGEWLTLTIIPSVLAFSDLGFGTAASNYFVLAYSEGNKKKTSDIYITGLMVISATVLLGVFLSFLIIWGAWKMGLLDKARIEPSDIILSLVFLMASRLSSFYMQLFEGFFRAKHKAATAFNLYTVEGVLRIIVGIITLKLGCNVVGYSFGQFLVAVFSNMVIALLAIRLVRDLPRGRFKKSIAVVTIKKGLGFMLTPIWQSLYMQGSTFVVRIVLGPVAVAVFNTVRTVCKSVNSVFAIVNGAIYPELQIAYGKGDTPLVKKIYIYSIQIVTVVALIGVLALMVFGPQLYTWWTRNELQVPSLVWSVFMIGIPFNAVWWTAGTVFRAINKPLRFSIYGFASALISTVMSYALSYPFHLLGAAIGFVLMDIVMFFLVIPLSNKEMDVSISDLSNLSNLRYGFKKFLKR